jgi:hypothetical protein
MDDDDDCVYQIVHNASVLAHTTLHSPLQHSFANHYLQSKFFNVSFLITSLYLGSQKQRINIL